MTSEQSANIPSSATQQQSQTIPTQNNADTNTIIEKAKKGINGTKFEVLFDGEWQKLGIYPSQSEADIGFCDLLAYWTNCDAKQMDEIFRQSKLMRSKWDKDRGGNSYGNITIARAIANFESFKRQGIAALISQQSLKPTDFSDAGNAELFTSTYKDRIVFVKELDWLVWNGAKWVENDLMAQTLALNLSKSILDEAKKEFLQSNIELVKAKSSQITADIEKAEEGVKRAKAFNNHALYSRNEPKISRMLKLSKSALELPLEQIDTNPFLLNTPSGVVDLQTGLIYPHNPAYYCSKITLVSPGITGVQIWLDFLNLITCGDTDLQLYLQRGAGMFAIGKVFSENVNIAVGVGGNGKSSYYNSLGTVLNDYYGTIKPEVLTMSYEKRGADLAKLKSKRLIIAAELDRDRQLSTSALKQLTSTDLINGEAKYKAPAEFRPSHSTVLYTNFLPKLTSLDKGTKRRIVVIPFNAQIKPAMEIKNYESYLVENAGPAILSWIIEGAKLFCQNGYKLDPVPNVVSQATADYISTNDKVAAFIAECCAVGTGYNVQSKILCDAYKKWREDNGELPASISDFTNDLLLRKFVKQRINNCYFWYGIALNPVSITT